MPHTKPKPLNDATPLPLALPSHLAFWVDGPAAAILLGGDTSFAGVTNCTTTMFWQAKAAQCQANTEAAVTLSKFMDQMFLKAMGLALVPVPDHPSKHVKIAESEVELSTDLKGKGKVRANTTDEDKVIVITKDADASGKEWDGLM